MFLNLRYATDFFLRWLDWIYIFIFCNGPNGDFSRFRSGCFFFLPDSLAELFFSTSQLGRNFFLQIGSAGFFLFACDPWLEFFGMVCLLSSLSFGKRSFKSPNDFCHAWYDFFSNTLDMYSSP